MASPAAVILAASSAVSPSPSAAAAVASAAAGWSCPHPGRFPAGSGEPREEAVSLEHSEWFSGSWLKGNRDVSWKKLAKNNLGMQARTQTVSQTPLRSHQSMMAVTHCCRHNCYRSPRTNGTCIASENRNQSICHQSGKLCTYSKRGQRGAWQRTEWHTPVILALLLWKRRQRRRISRKLLEGLANLWYAGEDCLKSKMERELIPKSCPLESTHEHMHAQPLKTRLETFYKGYEFSDPAWPLPSKPACR